MFQAHSTLHRVVMGANAKRGSRTQNEIIASKRELPVKTLNIRIHTLIISTLSYLVISFAVSAWSGTRSLLRALEAERNRVRS